MLDAHSIGSVSEVIGTSPAVPQLQNVDSPILHSSLVYQKGQGSTISRVLYYLDRNRLPSNCKLTGEFSNICQVLKFWNKLLIHDGVLCKVRRDLNMNR